ncbi:MAG TPA: hypothetical protein VHQ03_12575 [Candidatus Dormibacteraeota bacterium]|nr:hypothetical protein [Candidatus Dormibacteraeota bacterium]
MTRPKPAPWLIDFVTAYPGPTDVEFSGGSITVVATNIYRDGARLEWRIKPGADFSRSTVDVDRRNLPRELSNAPEIVKAHLNLRRLGNLWRDSTLIDSTGHEFELSLQRAILLEDGWTGTATCVCPPPIESTTLVLRMGGSDALIPCSADDADAQRRNGKTLEFRAGYPGPKERIAFHGGAVKLISALVYADRVTLEWLLDPLPDLSWLRRDDPTSRMIWGAPDPDDRPSSSIQTASDDAIGLWLAAQLIDDVGTAYLGSLGNAGTFYGGGLKGEVHFSPGPPANARELNLVLYDLSAFIPIGSR